MNESFAGIKFDENGICNFCNSSEGEGKVESLKRGYELKFIDLLSKFKDRNNYSCLMAYSGGKDSTYVLQLLKNSYGVNVLAFSFNNWFQSERAIENIQNVLMQINVDHIVFSARYDLFKEMVRISMRKGLYSMKALGRATAVCTTCLSIVRFVSLKIAVEKEIPLVIFAMSPGQAPISTAIFKTNPGIIKKMQGSIFRPLYEELGEAVRPYFLEDRHFEREGEFPYIVNPLAFLKYDEREIYDSIQKIGWLPPKDTDANSTNCLLNGFANQIHLEQFGFHPYAFEIAGLVRTGVLSREEGLRRLNEPNNEAVIAEVKRKLGITEK